MFLGTCSLLAARQTGSHPSPRMFRVCCSPVPILWFSVSCWSPLTSVNYGRDLATSLNSWISSWRCFIASTRLVRALVCLARAAAWPCSLNLSARALARCLSTCSAQWECGERSPTLRLAHTRVIPHTQPQFPPAIRYSDEDPWDPGTQSTHSIQPSHPLSQHIPDQAPRRTSANYMAKPSLHFLYEKLSMFRDLWYTLPENV